MTDKFKVGDLVVYIPTSGEIIESQISRILKIENGYIFLRFRMDLHKILPESIRHYPLPLKEKTFEIEI
jgi:hypothetical protein